MTHEPLQAALWIAGFVFCSAGCAAHASQRAAAPERTAAERPTIATHNVPRRTERAAPAVPREVERTAQSTAPQPPKLATGAAAQSTANQIVVHLMTNDVDLARQSVESEQFIQALRNAGAIAPPTLIFVDEPRVQGSPVDGPVTIWVNEERTKPERPGEVATVYHWVDWKAIGNRLDRGDAIIIQVASKDAARMMRFLQSDEFAALLRQSGVDRAPPVRSVDGVVYGAIRER